MTHTKEQIAEAAEAHEEIAVTLRDIAAAANQLLDSGLTRNALVLLIQDKCATKVSRETIHRVLMAMGRLDEHLTPPKGK